MMKNPNGTGGILSGTRTSKMSKGESGRVKIEKKAAAESRKKGK